MWKERIIESLKNAQSQMWPTFYIREQQKHPKHLDSDLSWLLMGHIVIIWI